MKRRQFLKGALYGTGGTMLTLGGVGTLTPFNSRKAIAADQDEEKIVHSACEMCRNQCPIEVRVKNNKIVKVDGNPFDPTVKGSICARGQAGPSLLYDPQRIKKPMIRTGDRGSGKFKEVSWDEAYDHIATKLKEIIEKNGPESVTLASRKGPHDLFFRQIAKAIGSPNQFSHEATCPMTRNVALHTTFGSEGVGVDYGNAKYIISLGRNWFEGIKVPEIKGLMKALENGAKLIMLDPRYNVTASKGEWVPIKGGSDLAFVMAMANVLIKENLYDKDFLDQYTVGFDKWVEAVKDKTPEWAEQETGIPKDKIIQITKEFAAAAPHAFVDPGWRTSWTSNDYQLRRAILIVNMMIGNFEVPGGIVQNKASFLLKSYPDQAGYMKDLGGAVKFPAPKSSSKLRIDDTGKHGTPGQLIVPYDGAVGKIVEAILDEKPYPIKAWLIHRFNPVITLTDTNKVIEALKKVDFVMTCDVYMTDTAYYSDVVLPECTFLERTEQVYDMSGGTPRYVLRQKAIDPIYPETKPAWQIYKELGEKMGIGDYFPYKDIDEVVANQLNPAGLLDHMKDKGVWTPPGMKPFYVRERDRKASIDGILFGKSDKKIAIFSEEIQEATGEGLPVYVKHPQPQESEFRFVQGKVAVHTNAGTHNVPILNELMPSNTLWINSQSAQKLGVKDGDEVVITSVTKEGKYEVKGKAKVTEAIRPDTVFAYHGFGRISPELKRAFGKGIHGNKLIPHEIGIVGNTVTSTTFVKVKKA